MRSGTLAALMLGSALMVVVGAMFFHAGHGPPAPRIHDEFAYLLQADTFAQGRLTNPSHPMARYFTTFYVFFEPTYQAKYPPAQGAALGLGQAVFGHPVVGVWLSAALALAALAWFLAHTQRPWVVAVTTLICAGSALLFLEWVWSYWGGYVAFFGGALLWGSACRLSRQVTPGLIAILGLGLFILANSRPLEGLLTAAMALGFVAWSLRGRAFGDGPRQLLVGLVMIAVVVGGWQLLYNAAVSLDPLRMPYFNARIDRSIDVMAEFSGSTTLPLGPALARLQAYFLPWPGTLLLLGLLATRRRPIVLAALASLAVLFGVSHQVSNVWPHYLAPMAPLFYWLLAEALSGLARWRPGDRSVGLALVVVGVVLQVLLQGLALQREWLQPATPAWSRSRLEVIRTLEETPGQDLVLVRYGEGHSAHAEWVYNEADIDAAPVVWARFYGWEETGPLLTYFADRQVWLLEPDARPIRLNPVAIEPPPG